MLNRRSAHRLSQRGMRSRTICIPELGIARFRACATQRFLHIAVGAAAVAVPIVSDEE
jgi:hypothetical protein